ncbi:hypothetical protein GCM10023169_31660 [Georgenia halophila]|uniref:WXG100 family type VII secretion target n=1 Tax=Georgenia halophila TaxID=620889 RepID=A0ABP8LJ52_9MICO
MVYMPPSPRGRNIEQVEGSADEIVERGDAIATLGQQMLDSADTLETIATRAIGDGTQKGQAIEKLKESVGDSYNTLREAGQLYEPVGPVIKKYGEELAAVQPSIKTHVENCESLWSTYVGLPGEVEPRGTGGLFEPDEDSPEAEKQAEEDAAKKQAYEEWEGEAQLFDSSYDTWETAFEDAASSITDEMAGTIEDSFWDTIGDFLGVAALILGVAAMFIGGWVIAAIAVAVGAAFLFVTYMQYTKGEKTLMDIGLAGLAILPVGKIANLTKLAHGGRGLKAFGEGALGNIAKLKPANGLQRLSGKIFKEKPFVFNGWGGGLKNATLGSLGRSSVRADHMRLYTGQAGRQAFLGGGREIVKIASTADLSLRFMGNLAGWSGRVAGLPDSDWKDPFPKWTGALL